MSLIAHSDPRRLDAPAPSSRPRRARLLRTLVFAALTALTGLIAPAAAQDKKPEAPTAETEKAGDKPASSGEDLSGAELAAAIEGEADAGKRAELLGQVASLDPKERKAFLAWAEEERGKGKRLKHLGPALASMGDAKAAAALGSAARSNEDEQGSSRKALKALASMPASVAVPELLKGCLKGSRPVRRWHREELGRVLARGPDGVRFLETTIENLGQGRSRQQAETIATEVVAAAIGVSKKARGYLFKLEGTRSAFLARALAQGIARRPEMRRRDPASVDKIRSYVQSLERILENHQEPAVLIDVFKTYRRASVTLNDTWAQLLIDCLADRTHGGLKREAWITLKILTGQNLRQSKAEWDAWWKSQSSEENP